MLLWELPKVDRQCHPVGDHVVPLTGSHVVDGVQGRGDAVPHERLDQRHQSVLRDAQKIHQQRAVRPERVGRVNDPSVEGEPGGNQVVVQGELDGRQHRCVNTSTISSSSSFQGSYISTSLGGGALVAGVGVAFGVVGRMSMWCPGWQEAAWPWVVL